jgi:PAS domain S-box-containing protein
MIAALLLVATVATGLYLGTQTQSQFRDVAWSWESYAGDVEKKGAWISSIRGHLGYGGIIHNFKNYVLRKDPRYLIRLREQLEGFDRVMKEYLASVKDETEKAALDRIRYTIASYQAKLPIAMRAADESWPVEKTDHLVKVDDTAAIDGLRIIEQLWQDERLASTGRIIAAVGAGERLINIGFASMFALVFVALALAGLLALLLGDNYANLARLTAELAERKRLEQSEKKLARVVEQSPATIIITDTDSHIQYVNRRFTDLTGYVLEDLSGQTPRLLQSGETPSQSYDDMKQALALGDEWRGIFRNRKKNGEIYWADTTILPLKGEDGSVVNFIGIGEDITEKIRAREQVVRAQKMEAVGLLAGGIAHDFNNILTTIMGAAHLARMDAVEGTDLEGEIGQIEIAATRARDLVQQLLTFARRQPAKPQIIDLNAISAEVLHLIRASVPPTIQFHLETSDKTVPAVADPTQMHQVLMNLCRNAVEAIGSREGNIWVRVGRSSPVKTQAPDEKRPYTVYIAVKDDGPGMTKETAQSVFDAFFTTKPLGKGTGLGLTIVNTLVQEMDGQVALDTKPGKGTVFTITLPAADSEALAPVAAISAVRGHERILIVDDEPHIASIFRRFLTRMGYQVDAYTDPAIALSRFNEDPLRYEAVITDLIMPGMSGEALADELWRLRPGLGIIMITAYGSGNVSKTASSRMIVLDKPIDPPMLARRLRDILDGIKTAA